MIQLSASALHVRYSRRNPLTRRGASSFVYSVASKEKRRRWFADLLWRTFPGASMREKAQRAAPVLDLSPRQIENLMKMEHDAKLPTVLAVLALAGAECIFEIIEGRDE